MYLQNEQNRLKANISENNKSKQKNIANSPKKSTSSSKSIIVKSQKKTKSEKIEKNWMSYLGCLKYFFSDSPKS